MTRLYAFLSLLIVTGVLRPLSLAQEPSPQSPTINRQSFLAEIMRRRLSPPTIASPVGTEEEPVLRIKTVVLRLPATMTTLRRAGERSFMANQREASSSQLHTRPRRQAIGHAPCKHGASDGKAPRFARLVGWISGLNQVLARPFARFDARRKRSEVDH